MTADGLSVSTVGRLEQSLAACAGLPLTPGQKLDVIATITDYVCGFVLKSDLEPDARGSVPARAAEEFVRDQVTGGACPHLAALAGSEGGLPELLAVFATMSTADDRFEQGLTQLISGVRLGLGA
jgi:hypothetical protein